MTDETIPHLKFSTNGRLSHESRAAVALMALRDCEVASKCEALENLYLKWKYGGVRGSIGFHAGLWARFVLWIAKTPVSIFRSEIAELATALQESMARENQQGLQNNFGAEYLRLTDDLRGFRKFLLNHFPDQMEMAESLNVPLLEVAKGIMVGPRLPSPSQGIHYQPLNTGDVHNSGLPPAKVGDNRG